MFFRERIYFGMTLQNYGWMKNGGNIALISKYSEPLSHWKKNKGCFLAGNVENVSDVLRRKMASRVKSQEMPENQVLYMCPYRLKSRIRLYVKKEEKR